MPLCHSALPKVLCYYVNEEYILLVQTLLPGKNLVVYLAIVKSAGPKSHSGVNHYLTNDHYLVKLMIMG